MMNENLFVFLYKYKNVKISFDKKKAKQELSKMDFAILRKKIRKINKLKDKIFRALGVFNNE